MKNINKFFSLVPKYIFILILVSYFIFIPAKNNYGIYGHDSLFHAVNILAMDSNTSFFEFPSRIRPIVAKDFGYGSGIFYPQFFHFSVFIICKLVKFFHISSISLSNCINIYLFLFTFVVSLCMRKLLYKYTANSKVSTIGAILYILYPYYINDIYVRSAYGELIVFLSLPIIFLGLFYLFDSNEKIKFYICFVLGFHLLFSSHIISSLYTVIFVSIFLLVNRKKLFKNKNIIHLAIASFFAVLISLNYLIPILEHSILGDYLVFKNGIMSSKSNVLKSILPLDNLLLISKETDWLDAFIPISLILLVGYLLINYKKIVKIVDKDNIKGYLYIFVIACILVVVPFIWKLLPSIFINIQFVWRNCSYIGFSICVLAMIGLSIIPKKYFNIVSISTLIISLIIFLYIVYYPNHITTYNNWISNVGSMGVQMEYLPTSTYDNLEYFNSRDNNVFVVNGNAKIKILEDDTPNLKFKITINEEIIVEIPRLYYLWYEINLLDNNKNKINLEFYENENGFIEFLIPESGVVTVKYKKTFISNFAFIISIISVFIFCLYLYLLYKNKKILFII